VLYSEYSMIQYDIAKTIFTDDIYCNPSGSYICTYIAGPDFCDGSPRGGQHSFELLSNPAADILQLYRNNSHHSNHA
jgi:hypothetical protein